MTLRDRMQAGQREAQALRRAPSWDSADVVSAPDAVRLAPPLVLTDAELDEVVARLDRALTRTAADGRGEGSRHG